ncbi:ABC transporter ATP-binding protein [Brevibacillus parabrevis]|uniref:energy-coupling factor ABC transporter ATP-binding protein n=1 Tax=Brevibacillus parabrevis TaxID=54914 RepID=UPI002E204E88|nr:ABC transporter ATP-binding protein [Brevibacillus parabrevis]
MNSVIKISNMSYKYPTGKIDVLKNINIEIEKGLLYAVVGPNGGGKTTFCNVLRGFIPHFYRGDLRGEVLVNGKNIVESTLGELSLSVGFVFQNPFIQISGVKETVFEEVAYGLENLGVHPDEIRTRVEAILKLVKIEHLRDKNPFELSGGQRQRVALASIIVMEPDILVIDEPTSQLDPQGTEEVFEIIQIMKEKGKTIILVEHKIELIAEFADRVILLHDGEIVMEGTTQDVLSDEKALSYDVMLPQYAMLGLELKKRGVPLRKIPITEEQAVEEMNRWMAERGVRI